MGNPGNGPALRAEAKEKEREAQIKDGMSRIDTAFKGFDENFFNQQRQAQLDYALPQIRQQYSDAQQKLTYALARGGQLNSSVAARRNAQLLSDHTVALSQADSAADQAVKSARSDIERERANLVGQLQVTADPSAAANMAGNTAKSLRVGQPLADVGILFQNATAGLAAALTPTYDAYGNRVSGGGVSVGRTGNNSRVIG